MRIEISLGQRIEQKLEQKIALEQKLELKQELTQQILLQIPKEFLPFIDLDNDDDLPLLQKSLPFLALHEFSHILEHRKILLVPTYSPSTLCEIGQECQVSESEIIHDLIETAVDKSAYLVGQEACGKNYQDMIESHCALIERVYRDSIEREKINIGVTFMARSYAALKNYKTFRLDSIAKKRVNEIAKKLETYGTRKQGWDHLVEFYSHTFAKAATKGKQEKSHIARPDSCRFLI